MKICPVCRKKFTDDKKFCNIDGSKLIDFEMPEENLNLNKPAINIESSNKNQSGAAGNLSEKIEKSKMIVDFKPASLTFKIGGNLTDKVFDLKSNYLIAGRFDSSAGPIDIDLSGFSGDEHISRKHAKFTFENGKWFVSDAGSTNGVFVKSASANEFSSRITEPVELNNGDEVSLGNMIFMFNV